MAKKPDVSNLPKQERKDLLKDFKKNQESKEAKKSMLIKLVIAIVIVAVVGGVGYLLATADPQASLQGEEVPIQGREHINPGTKHEAYNSNPPTSGPHWPTPQTCDFYTEEVNDEAVIHSMEHGAVWISYKDKNDTELVDKLRSVYDQDPSKVLVSPRAADENKIVLASWGRLLKLDNFDEGQISSFIKSNRNNSPEPLAACEGITHNPPPQ